MKPTFFSKLPTDLKLVCVAFYRTNGGNWRTNIRANWNTDRDQGALRRLRNTVGPSDLNKIRTCDIRDYLPVAEQLAAMKSPALSGMAIADDDEEAIKNPVAVALEQIRIAVRHKIGTFESEFERAAKYYRLDDAQRIALADEIARDKVLIARAAKQDAQS